MHWRASVWILAAAVVSPQAPRQQVSLIVTNGTVLTMDGAGRIVPGGAVAIDGREIAAVGPADEIRARFSAADTLDVAGHVVLPGLINTHTHAPMVLYRGLADDLALM